MALMASSVPAVKKGLRVYLQAVSGLTSADGVVIRSAATDGFAAEQITLGDVTATQDRPDLSARKGEQPTMTCWLRVVRSGDSEVATDAARDRVGALFGLVQQALEQDPTAAGAVPAPAYTTVSESTWTEYPGDTDGVAERICELRFSITWTSHGI